MTVSVIIENLPPSLDTKETQRLFKEVHNHEGWGLGWMKEEKDSMIGHGVNFEKWDSDDRQIHIPCHWNLSHAKETLKQITDILQDLGLKGFKGRIS